ncbi:MAG: S-layer homology domain-containing protein [Armatimonadota bacterium]|nr:S-layer homology domain-containing protein [Armatimonadota bacterium]MCX7777276.1 S-layer homology domain-containing protein [Armatimonadota bacterium]MDW8024690.1 S-layer homology domain-containing protein [Armatimonadota bacterium]
MCICNMRMQGSLIFSMILLATTHLACLSEELPNEIKLDVGASAELTVKGLSKAIIEDTRVASLLPLSVERISIQGMRAGETTLRIWVGDVKYEVPVKVEAKPAPKETQKEAPAGEQVAVGDQPPIELPELKLPEDDEQFGEATAVKAEKEPKLSVAIAPNIPAAVAGAEVQLKVTVSNVGDVAARNIKAFVPLPGNVELVLDSPKPKCDYDAVLRRLVWRLDELKPGEKGELSFAVALSQELAIKERLGFIAMVECEGALAKVASQPAEVEIVSAALSTVFAFPEAFVVRRPIGLPLLDVRHEEYQKAVDRLQGLGIVHGYPDHTFRPDRPVTRAEATKMLVLTTDLKEHTDSVRIGYVLSAEAKVDVAVLDASGKRIAHLVRGERRKPMQYFLSWDGRADDGTWVEPGQYEIQVTATTDGGQQVTLSTTVRALPVAHRKIGGIPTFVDVRPTDWFSGYIAEAQARKLVYGYPDGSFKPKRDLTRAEAAALVVRALGLEENAAKAKDTLTPFEDDELIPAWARGYIVVAATEAPKASGNLILGYPGKHFKPQRPISRAEAATMMTRFLDRDVERKITVVGAVAPGIKLNINGREIGSGEFKHELELKPGVNLIAVMVR